MTYELDGWRGPGEPFAILYDDDATLGRSLPRALQAIYGDWRLPDYAGRPYIYTNFVISHDGRVSFSLPGARSGAAVSRFNNHDRWLMGLLRARADAILMGDNTLRVEPEHRWTAEAIYPDEADCYTLLRQAEGRAATPLLVFASYGGNIPADAAIFSMPDIRVLIATTVEGSEHARRLLRHVPSVEYLVLGTEAVDLAVLTRTLHRDYGVRTLLCEGGPTLYGALLAAGQGDDEFLTISPIIIGNSPDGPPRPSLVEGVRFGPFSPPTSQLIGVRRAGSYLFVRSRYACV